MLVVSNLAFVFEARFGVGPGQVQRVPEKDAEKVPEKVIE
jgi:hypothetical protein